MREEEILLVLPTARLRLFLTCNGAVTSDLGAVESKSTWRLFASNPWQRALADAKGQHATCSHFACGRTRPYKSRSAP
jgi:hypothetical protein